MAKNKLVALAILGINVGLLLGSCSKPEAALTGEAKSFYEQLDAEGKRQFLELDTDHQRAAMSIIDQGCKASHDCKGTREKAVQQQYELQQQGN